MVSITTSHLPKINRNKRPSDHPSKKNHASNDRPKTKPSRKQNAFLKSKRIKHLQEALKPPHNTNSTYIFIGRVESPPFVFSCVGQITSVNLHWIITGDIDEKDYLGEVDLRRYSRPDNLVWDVPSKSPPRKSSVKMGVNDGRGVIDLTSAD